MSTGEGSQNVDDDLAADDDLAGLRAERDALAAERNVLQRECEVLRAQLADATAGLVHWRAAALHRWEAASLGAPAHPGAAQELEAIRSTLSWRVTKPLRAVRSRMPTPPGGR